MRREGLRLKLAEAILRVMGSGGLTLRNVKRHVSRSVLSLFSIRHSTTVTDADWLIALQVVLEERTNRFRLGTSFRDLPLQDRLRRSMETLRIKS